MLITQKTKSGQSRQGRPVAGLSQLREQLACPKSLTDDSRQRLLELDKRLKRLSVLCDEHFRVGFSESAALALEGTVAVA
ncbi:MAG: hypothetical protein GY794_17605 [bacterium]|nr:hypothetical protein [bacterium]